MTAASTKVMIMAGGTGGHIFPGLAVAKVLKERAAEVVWLGSNHGLENTLVPKADIAMERIEVRGLRGKGVASWLTVPFKIMASMRQAMSVMKQQKPDVVISFGGFAAGPGGMAAKLLGLPLLVHEQNRIPGWTNKILKRMAKAVLSGFPDAFGAQTVWAGNPVREAIAQVPAPEQRTIQHQPLRVLIVGGSQGARALNQHLPAVFANIQAQGHELRITHQCGKKHEENTRAAYDDAGVTADVRMFIDDMAKAFAEHDLVICRAGASTLAELCAVGIGAILVPFPFAVDDHQTANARYLVDQQAALLESEGDDFVARVTAALNGLLAEPAKLMHMAKAARTLAKTDAAQTIADRCLAEVRS